MIQKAIPEIFKLIGEPWVSGMDPADQTKWLQNYGFTLDQYISFYDAHDKLNVQEYHGSDYFGIMNFAIVSKS